MTLRRVFGEHESRVHEQLQQCLELEPDAQGVLCADAHIGYAMPIGGVVAYKGLVSPSAVGVDIACGVIAVETPLLAADIRADLPRLMDEVWSRLRFGAGKERGGKALEHPVVDAIAGSELAHVAALADKAERQLGTIGGGNHYVDLLEAGDTGRVWVAAHFGSRGFGYKLAEGFSALAAGLTWQDRAPHGLDAPPCVIAADSPLGQDYLEAMRLAGDYASAGRQWVAQLVVQEILATSATDLVHNHHNFCFIETHDSEKWFVHRKGATPAWPAQRGFVGGSMGDVAAVVRGVDSTDSAQALYSTVHGAGRVMGRRAAAGKKGRPGLVDWPAAQAALRCELRGGGADEAPACYRPLREVLEQHKDTITIDTWLTPLGVAMAGDSESW